MSRISKKNTTEQLSSSLYLTLKKVFVGLVLLTSAVFISCNGENVPDCFQNAGDLVRKEISVPDFTKITVFENVELILKSGPTFKAEIATGEFLIDEVSLKVEGDRLLIRDENNCNLFREYGSTKVYITAPEITEIRSSTGFPIRSDGALAFSSLTLYAESFIDPTATTTDGSFLLDLDTQDVNLIVNGIAFMKLGGTTTNLNIIIAAGDSRIEAEDLIAENVVLNHRGSNDIFINPQQLLEGVIRGTGNVISANRPAIVDVQELYTGSLIFND
ncbi:head GIN domain-containing protein [Muriicola sp. Z0-33]|uniref:head GIN domain-containing protein n=1 Tax=Muriicola sp. Z0-33 TaxID=2816957 RepID=UPI0022378F97|nr:head GIN domain-containing protein [Muriicola sp. Z0-33]